MVTRKHYTVLTWRNHVVVSSIINIRTAKLPPKLAVYFILVWVSYMALITHPHLEPRLNKEYSYSSTPAVDLQGVF